MNVQASLRLSKRWFPCAFAVLMGLAMTGVVTLALSLVSDPVEAGFAARWLPRWLLAWLVATPLIALLSPPLRRWLACHVEPPGV